MAKELTEELKVLVTAEVNKAVADLKKVDKQTDSTEKLFKQLGKTIGSVVSTRAIVGFVKDSMAAYEAHDQVVKVLNSTLKTTGATAWTTASELMDMAGQLQKATNYSGDSINQMQTVLLGFKNITGETFGTATKAILDMATVMKMDLSSAAQTVGKALDDPVNGITSLQRQGFRFTESQKEMIQSMLAVGDVAGAQNLILEELNTTYGGAAEAAQTSSQRIKNSLGDVLTGYGKLFTELAEKSRITSVVADALDYLADAALNFSSNLAHLAKGDTYKKWFDALDISDQLKESRSQLETWQKELDKALESGKSKDIDTAIRSLDYWRRTTEQIQNAVTEQQRLQKAENDRVAAEAEIHELMTAINGEYTKMSATDPSVQLENYRKKLGEIKEERNKLLTTTTGIDTSSAVKSLDYLEKAYSDKIKAMTAGGKKSWREWLSEIENISVGFSDSGKDAADKFIASLDKELDSTRNISELLTGKFDTNQLVDALEKQRDAIKTALEKMFEVDTSEIDEAFTSQDRHVQALAERYRQLGDEIENAMSASKSKPWQDWLADIEGIDVAMSDSGRDAADKFIASLERQFDNTKSISELLTGKFDGKELASALEKEQGAIKSALEKLFDIDTENIDQAFDSQNEHVRALAERYMELGDKINEALDETSIMTWHDFVSENVMDLMEKINALGNEAQTVIGNLATQLIEGFPQNALTGFESFGEALAKGASAGESLSAAIADMAQQILNQLPTMFLQAGLQLIAQGQWALGLGFIAAAGTTAAIGGYVKGAKSSAKEKAQANALGGVYGSSDYEAFALGGTFTNTIVDEPTYFKFAKGSGFGTGLMGEAGPEAIMPLSRGADGSLGVKINGAAGNGSVQISMPVYINNYSQENVDVKETTDDAGSRKIEVTIGALINQHLSSGKADKAMKSRYGVSARGF